MKSGFTQTHPDFAAIENHIRRAHAERAVVIGSWIAAAIAGAVQGARGLFARPTGKPAPARLVMRITVPR